MLTSTVFKYSVIPWHLLYPRISCVMVFGCSFFNLDVIFKVGYRLMSTLCLLLTDIITYRRYTELDPTACRRVLDFISGGGLSKRNTNIKKKHMWWMHLQAQRVCFQEKNC